MSTRPPRRRFDRRTFIEACGAGATALCLPVLRQSVARAAPGAPACFVAVYRATSANGTYTPIGTVQARTSFSPAVKYVCSPRSA